MPTWVVVDIPKLFTAVQAATHAAGSDHVVELFGVRLLGVTAATGRKIALSAVVLVGLAIVGWVLRRLVGVVLRGDQHVYLRFWWRQAIRLVVAALSVLVLVSIWFDDPSRLTTAAGLITAGLTVALQRFVTAFAAYFVILRGRVFRIGDRIVMAGVRGDVIALGFIRTTIMEMGQPPDAQSDAPAMWVGARQYTGRIVTVTNDTIFNEPVYNYSRDFPYIWEELHVGISYTADRARAEAILLEAAQQHTVDIQALGAAELAELRQRYFAEPADVKPRVYWRLTDNWLELSVRFLVRERGVREVKDAINRQVIAELDKAGIGIASGTYEIVGMPPLKIERYCHDGVPTSTGP